MNQISIRDRHFPWLLGALVFTLLVHPLLVESSLRTLLFHFFLWPTLIAGTYALSKKARLFRLCLVLGLLSIGFGSFSQISGDPSLGIPTLVANILFLLLASFGVLMQILETPRVSGNLICGALSVYLMLGLMWALFYMLLDVFTPGSFQFPVEDLEVLDQRKASLLIYYSFVTFTTLGYGDVVPLTPAARFYAMTQAICGTFYVAILIARLVALQIADARNEPSRKS